MTAKTTSSGRNRPVWQFWLGPAAALRACRARSEAFPQLGFSKRQVKHSAGLPNRSIAAKKRGSCRRTEDVAGLSGSWSGIVRSRAVPRGAAAGIPPQTVESLLVFHVKRLYAHACSPAGVRPMLRPPSALVRAYGAGSRWHSVWFAQSASSVHVKCLCASSEAVGMPFADKLAAARPSAVVSRPAGSAGRGRVGRKMAPMTKSAARLGVGGGRRFSPPAIMLVARPRGALEPL